MTDAMSETTTMSQRWKNKKQTLEGRELLLLIARGTQLLGEIEAVLK